MMNRTLIALAAAAAARFRSPALTAQAPPAPPDVTFQVEVNYVDVDVVVTDEKGNFVSGLTRDDFEVFEDGKPQKVDTFAYVEIPVERERRIRARRPKGLERFADEPRAVRRASLRDRARRPGRERDADGAGEEIGQGVRREVHGGERHRGGRPYERPNRCLAGIHQQQSAAECRHRQVHGSPHALAHDRAARRVLPEPLDDPE